MSLGEDNTHKMYQLPTPNCFLNQQFLQSFTKQNPSLTNLLEEWWDGDTPFHKMDHRIYNAQYIKARYQILVAMICCIYGEANNIHFTLEWVTLAQSVAEEGNYFNWAQILSDNIFQSVGFPYCHLFHHLKSSFFITFSSSSYL